MRNQTLRVFGPVVALVGAACSSAPAEPATPIQATGTNAAEAPSSGTFFETGAAAPHGGMMRYPAISATHIAFVYGEDLWTVPREGGSASPLASPIGAERMPRFSPDGATLSFSANYDGNAEIYTLPVAGGVPHRVTHHPSYEVPNTWTPDGDILFFASGRQGLGRQTHLYKVDPAGGMPEQLPVPYGAVGSISGDGVWLAYTPHTRDARTWKRYRGGMATDIWLVNLQDGSSRKVTDWEGTDTQPMWHGGRLYYLSDAGPKHRLNLWTFDPASGDRAQLTRFEDNDVKWPSIGPGANGEGEIIFQLGADLKVVDLSSSAVRDVAITVPGARPQLRHKAVDAAQFITGYSSSPSGERVALSGRGDIWSLAAEKGAPRNLTRTSGANERGASWSPDGRWIAYFSDATGEYELYVTQSDGKGETKQLTDDAAPYRNSATWSPDSEHIAFTDKAGKLFVHTVESGETKHVDSDPFANYGSDLGLSWSHDSSWLAYHRAIDGGMQSALFLHDLESGETQQLTSGMFSDSEPTFDRAGDYLYYQSNREFQPAYSDVSTSFVYANTERLLVVPLRDDVGSPFAPKVDEVSWEEDDGASDESEENGTDEEGAEEASEDGEDAVAMADEEGGESSDDGAADSDDAEEAEQEEERLAIDIEGFERRAIPLPIDAGAFREMAVNESGALIYMRSTSRGFDGENVLQIFDASADEPEEGVVLGGLAGFELTPDGSKVLAIKPGGVAGYAAASKGADFEAISTKGMRVMIDPREEWAQILRDAWRTHRDFFYVENMHGVDWPAVYDHYAAMLPDCVTRDDVSYLIREMISELNVGHAYYWGGDTESADSVNVGMLGADFALENGGYRIERIIEGAAWDSDARGPLSQPGVDVAEGDYLLAVDGMPVDASKDPWAAFQGLAGATVTLTVSAKPEADDEARDVVVKLMGSESGLRYRHWVEQRRAMVEEMSGGRVGYIYVPDTGVNGQNELVRQFFGQLHKDALLIDDRWNGGGQIPTRFIEMLNRPVTNYWARRDGTDWPWPPDAHQGPKAMLINGLAGSGGDAFPAYFKQAGLGKLIGMRTWGGLVGISGNPGMIDGGYTAVPTFGFYDADGTWGIEGHGVDPDIEVVDDPAQMKDGADPQLAAGVTHLLERLKTDAYQPPARPAAPDRSGMGIPDSDK